MTEGESGPEPEESKPSIDHEVVFGVELKEEMVRATAEQGSAETEDSADVADDSKAEAGHETDSEPAVAVIPEPTRFDITESVLARIALGWRQYCGMPEGEQISYINQLIAEVSQREDPDRKVVDEAAASEIEERLNGLLHNTAVKSGEVVRMEANYERGGVVGTLMRAVSSIRSLGFSEIGRAIAHSVSNESEPVPAELELSIAESRRLAQVETLTTSIGAVGLTSAIGRKALGVGLSFVNPIGRAVVGAASGLSAYFSAQQLSKSGLLALRRHQNFSCLLRDEQVVDRNALASFRVGATDTEKIERRQTNLGKLHGVRKLAYRLTSNKIVDGITQYYEDRRITPDRLKDMVQNHPDEGYIWATNIAAWLQHELDQRWYRRDREAGLLDANDWQVQLYLSAMTLLAEEPQDDSNEQPSIGYRVKHLGELYDQHQRSDRTITRLSHGIGAVTGLGIGYISAMVGFGAGKVEAHDTAPPSEPTPAPPSEPTPATPELRPELLTAGQINAVIEKHAVELLNKTAVSEHLADVRSAIDTQNDEYFFAITGHHLTDLDYLEHVLRAQIAEEVAHAGGHSEVDIWRHDGTVDVSQIEHGDITNLHITDGQMSFDNLTTDQLNHHLTTVDSNLFSDQTFAELRIHEVTTAVQTEVIQAGHDHQVDTTGFEVALKTHLDTFVSQHHGAYDFRLSDGSLRLEARHFMSDWIKEHTSLPVDQTKDVISNATANATAGNIPVNPSVAFDWKHFLIPQTKPDLAVETPVFNENTLTLADRFMGNYQETPVLTEPKTLIDSYLGHQTETPVLDLSHHSDLLAHDLASTHSETPVLAEAKHLLEREGQSQVETPVISTDLKWITPEHPAVVESEVFKQAVGPDSSLHHYDAVDNRPSILVGEADLGESIPLDQSSFVVK